MKHLDPPTYVTREIIDACVASIEAGSLKTRLGEVANAIVSAEGAYLNAAADASWFTIAQAANVGGIVTGDEMKRVYKGTFVKSTRTRRFYDAIKKLPKNDICPLCSQRTVFTLDHYLAQTFHPALVVAPPNLVPACGECNKKKLDRQPKSAADQTFHPYFDNFDDDRWLTAVVEATIPARVVFSVSPPATWGAVNKQRIENHFVTFGLGALYASHSGAELANIRFYLNKIAQSGTAETIRNFLREQAESALQVHRNSWRTATYFAFSESDWFCSGGFALT